MPPSQYHKPETALTKARELIKCDKKSNALEVLYDVMRARRAKQWQKVIEELMTLFVELCVELRKNAHFRKAIYQYKNMSLMENAASFEQIIRYYISQIKSKTEAAELEFKGTLLDVEDLDVLETPESLMQNAVSTEYTQDRSARSVLMLWVRFLWDAYRSLLDLLRGNSKLENLYHEVANDAYDFCVKYTRKTEFKKLCELIRQHTQKVQNQLQPNTPNAINLNTPETQMMHFETRLKQLDCAMSLNMYSEAFRTVEDIWNFILASRKPASAQLITNYYLKSSQLFLSSASYLYHAAALHKLFTLYRDHKKNITREELSALGSRVLCATVSIPLPNAKVNADKFLLSGEYTTVKQKTLAGLLGLLQIPTRQSLIREVIRHKIDSIVPPELAKLFNALEADFQPLKLWEHAQPGLEYMSNSPELRVYITQLYDVIVAKTLLQLSQVYQTIKYEEIYKLCPFMDHIRVERCIIELIHNLELPIRVNHLVQAISFDQFTDLGISQCEYGGQLVSQSTHVNDPDKLSRQLTLFAQVMQQITEILEVDHSLSNHRKLLLSDYRKNAQHFHSAVLNRRYLTEKRKEDIETLQAKRDQYFIIEEAHRQAEQKRLLQNEEMNLLKEAEERERLKVEEEKAHLKRRMAQENYNLFLEHKLGSKLDTKELTEEQLDQFDVDKLLEKKALEMKRKRKEIIEKVRAIAKKLDYYVRATRLEEIPLLQNRIEPEANEARALFERNMKEIEEHSKTEHARQLKESNRLILMKPDVQHIVAELKEARDKRYKERLTEWELLCDKTRTERLAQREAEARIREDELRKEAERQRELADETERLRAELEAKEAAEREAAKKEEPKPWVRGGLHKDIVPPRAIERESTWSSQPITAANRDFRRDDNPKPFGAWSRETKSRGGHVSSDFSSRNDQSSLTARNPIRRTLPTEFEQTTHDDDPNEGWTRVGHRRETERSRPFAFGNTSGAGKSLLSSTDGSQSSVPWRRQGPLAMRNAVAGGQSSFGDARADAQRPWRGSFRGSGPVSEDRKN